MKTTIFSVIWLLLYYYLYGPFIHYYEKQWIYTILDRSWSITTLLFQYCFSYAVFCVWGRKLCFLLNGRLKFEVLSIERVTRFLTCYSFLLLLPVTLWMTSGGLRYEEEYLPETKFYSDDGRFYYWHSKTWENLFFPYMVKWIIFDTKDNSIVAKGVCKFQRRANLERLHAMAGWMLRSGNTPKRQHIKFGTNWETLETGQIKFSSFYTTYLENNDPRFFRIKKNRIYIVETVL